MECVGPSSLRAPPRCDRRVGPPRTRSRVSVGGPVTTPARPCSTWDHSPISSRRRMRVHEARSPFRMAAASSSSTSSSPVVCSSWAPSWTSKESSRSRSPNTWRRTTALGPRAQRLEGERHGDGDDHGLGHHQLVGEEDRRGGDRARIQESDQQRQGTQRGRGATGGPDTEGAIVEDPVDERYGDRDQGDVDRHADDDRQRGAVRNAEEDRDPPETEPDHRAQQREAEEPQPLPGLGIPEQRPDRRRRGCRAPEATGGPCSRARPTPVRRRSTGWVSRWEGPATQTCRWSTTRAAAAGRRAATASSRAGAIAATATRGCRSGRWQSRWSTPRWRGRPRRGRRCS